MFVIGFLGGAGLIRFLCRSWVSGCTDCCHWATRTPLSCACYWSQCHNQTILWTESKDLPHVFVHASRRPRAADTKNQGSAGEVDHRESDSTTNVVLQPDVVPVLIVDAITGTYTVSLAWGWSISYSCQHKGDLCWSLRERSRHGWLREMRVVCRRKSSPLGCHRKTLWGIHNHSQHPFAPWSSQGWYWGSYKCRCSHSCTQWRGSISWANT